MVQVLFRMEEVAAITTQSRSAVYLDAKNGDLKTVQLGSRRRVTRQQLERYLQRLTGQPIPLDDVSDVEDDDPADALTESGGDAA